MHGADEAILLNSKGEIAEGALSSLVWWRGDVLYAPDDTIPWLPSVTRQLVLEVANQSGVEVRLEAAKPESLIGCEVWLLGALHGIRVVTEWIDLGGELGPSRRAEAFSKRLRMLSTEI
jgi:branched-subunit amino acid aminotransferase/4-amino-4-deoxychorismate lyase